MTDDPFFKLPENSEWNAFIGRQGSVDNYADGYIEAALDLANLILNDRRYMQRDTLVLPILYNARHSVELHLKLIIGELFRVGILSSGHVANHDIASHFHHLFGNKVPDRALSNLLHDLQPFVESLARVDDDGQELRYHTNRDGERSLKGRSLANIEVIRDSLAVLKETLDNLKYRAAELCDEFRTGTHTKHLSRSDLFEIAKMLPPRAEWSEPKFDDCKKVIKEQFEIGSAEFSSALQAMLKNRHLNAVLGVETPLVHLSDEKAMFLVSKWQVFHPPRVEEDLGMDYFRRDFGAFTRDRDGEKEALNEILMALSYDEIADAETVFYLSRNNDYAEHYVRDLDSKKKEYRVASDPRMEAYNLMTKTNFLKDFRRGVRMLGRLNLADQLTAV